MHNKTNEFEKSDSKHEQMAKLIQTHRRDVPDFYEQGESSVMYIPVDDGEIRVFHHIPKETKTKRPIVFIPGFGTTPKSWREFHHTHHNIGEYYHIETRDKQSSKIKRHRKVNFTVDQIARDVGKAINYLGLDKRDYLILGTCFNGGVVLHGILSGYFDPPTIIVFDPFTKWTQNRNLVKFLMPLMPPRVLGVMKFLFAKLILANMKNEAQKERNIDTVNSAVPWIWRKFSLQNINFDLTDELAKVKSEVFVFHGPKDKYHPEGTFLNVANSMPHGRYFYMETPDENRELLAGIIGTQFAYYEHTDAIPESLQAFEVS